MTGVTSAVDDDKIKLIDLKHMHTYINTSRLTDASVSRTALSQCLIPIRWIDRQPPHQPPTDQTHIPCF